MTFAYYVESLAGEPEQALAQVCTSYELLEPLGEQAVLSSAAGRRAHALEALDRWDEAEHYVEIARHAAWKGDYDAQSMWLSAKAMLHAHRGEAAAALACAEEAVREVDTIDDLNLLGQVLDAHARVLCMLDRPEAARPVLERALAAYERKGNRVAAARTLGALAAL